MDKKLVVRGINAYGYKFDINATMDEKFYNSNMYNMRHFLNVNIKVMNTEGKEETKLISFYSNCGTSPLEMPKLYWEQVCFEDGTVINNKNAEELEQAAYITKLNYEFTHKSKFNDDLNQYVGCPVVCNSGSIKQTGVLLAVSPIDKNNNTANVSILGAGTLYMRLNSKNTMKVYKDSGEKLEQIDEIKTMEQAQSQPGNE